MRQRQYKYKSTILLLPCLSYDNYIHIYIYIYILCHYIIYIIKLYSWIITYILHRSYKEYELENLSFNLYMLFSIGLLVIQST